MDTLLFRVAGLDIHKKFVMACIRITDPQTGIAHEEVRRFESMTDELRKLRDWLVTEQITDVAMESTGVYWKPVWNILEGAARLILANAQELKQVPGRKSDVKDSQWIAHLLACGLITPSFVPPQAQRDLRDLTRSRTTLLQEQTRVSNRIQKVLEDANIKLASVASDVLGLSGRDMLASLAEGETDPHTLAELARGRLRKKVDLLSRALEGHVRPHHRFLLRQLLDHLAHLEEQIAAYDQQIGEVIRPFLDPRMEAHLDEVPGVNQRTIEVVVAEIGADMSHFPTEGHLNSWAGLSPGNEESAGKRKRSRSKPGNKWLKASLVEAARAAARTQASYFRAQYARLAARRGKNRAAVAVAHSLLTVIYHLLKDPQTAYQDLGVAYFDQRNPTRQVKHLVKRLENLGYDVALTPRDTAA